MGQCYISRRGTKTGGATEQLGIYPTGNDGRPMGNVTVIDNVISLSKYPFIENKNVLTIALSEKIRNFADYCFQKCSGLQNISIPNKVVAIPQYCFDSCTSLSKVVLSKSLTTIGQYAFQNCTGLYDIVIPDDIGTLMIGQYAFSNCKGLDNDTVTKLASRCREDSQQYAFANLTGITEVTTNYVCSYFFSNCYNLKKITILNPLNDGGFGQNVFVNCNNLNTVVLPDNATVINEYMFNGTNLANVNIPKSTVSIGNNAFNGTSIDNIEFPMTLTKIGNYAFYNCSKLTSMNIPDKMTSIGNFAFQNCSSLKTVTVSENASYIINQYAFQNTSIDDDSVKAILAHSNKLNPSIFDRCLSLVNIDVDRIFANIFSNCTNLKTAKLTLDTNKVFGAGDEAFSNDSSLETVLIYGNYITIGSAIFSNCKSLKTVHLPSSITTATNNSLTSTSSYYAFYNCTNLEDIQLGQGWNMSLRLNVSNKITVESMVAMFNSLKDLTGETAKTLTLGATNLAKLTDEQKEIATNKNWTLA